MGDIFSYIVTVVGLVGFWLAGRKVWWAWYINILNQFAWVAFSLITEYYAFLIGTAFYLVVFCRNAYLWTKNRPAKEQAAWTEEMTARDELEKVKPLGVIHEIYYQNNRHSQVSVVFDPFLLRPNIQPGDQVYYKE